MAGRTPRGKGPRFFTLDPAGKMLYAANENSDSVVGLTSGGCLHLSSSSPSYLGLQMRRFQR
ncbi:beta-propeller fold lactonase family protein (plasmid) [Ralstonia sp. R-29]|uniref:beta-propeller fold lactonase family protein n=1 Tax=Ralstonia sp. R-29 TaxID=3404059 RepID=UPI003CFB56FA